MGDGRDRDRIDRQGWAFLGWGLLLVAAAAGYFLVTTIVGPTFHGPAAATVSPRATR